MSCMPERTKKQAARAGKKRGEIENLGHHPGRRRFLHAHEAIRSMIEILMKPVCQFQVANSNLFIKLKASLPPPTARVLCCHRYFSGQWANILWQEPSTGALATPCFLTALGSRSIQILPPGEKSNKAKKSRLESRSNPTPIERQLYLHNLFAVAPKWRFCDKTFTSGPASMSWLDVKYLRSTSFSMSLSPTIQLKI